MSDRFFNGRQAAAVMKHELLGGYLPIFASMTGSVAGDVVYIDGYAGPGLYSDGTPGSPELALRTAEKLALNRGRATLRGHLIEKRRRFAEQLQETVDRHSLTDWQVHNGTADEKVPPILDELSPSSPLFAFLDPFGLAISFDLLTRVLKRSGRVDRRTGRRTGGAATEVLMNFSVNGIQRVGGQLTATTSHPAVAKAGEAQIRHLDAVLGGSWWQPIWLSGQADRFDVILEGYKNRVCRAVPGLEHYDIPVADRWRGAPAYYLVFFTMHPDGMWKFNEQVSLATEKYREFCHRDENLLFDPDPPEARRAAWEQEIQANVGDLLRAGQSFRPVDLMTEVFGYSLGYARETHVRAALNRLYDAQISATNPRGRDKLGWLTIRPGQAAMARKAPAVGVAEYETH